MSIWIMMSFAGLCWTLAVLAYREIPSGVTEENFCEWWREEIDSLQLLREARAHEKMNPSSNVANVYRNMVAQRRLKWETRA